MNTFMTSHFTFAELTKTNTGLDNTPTSAQQSRLRALALILENIRGVFGKPIYINSAFRSPRVNHAVGGSLTSFHLMGTAADISVYHLSENDKILLERCIMSHVPCEFIKYDTFWHVAFDISKLGREDGQPLTWDAEYPDIATFKTDKLTDL